MHHHAGLFALFLLVLCHYFIGTCAYSRRNSIFITSTVRLCTTWSSHLSHTRWTSTTVRLYNLLGLTIRHVHVKCFHGCWLRERMTRTIETESCSHKTVQNGTPELAWKCADATTVIPNFIAVPLLTVWSGCGHGWGRPRGDVTCTWWLLGSPVSRLHEKGPGVTCCGAH